MPESLNTIEHDIAELELRLKEKRAALEQERSEKEMLHEAVGERIRQHIPSYQSADPGSLSSTPVQTEPSSYLSDELRDQIQNIITVIFSKNLDEGIREAAKTGNPALIDALHDILTDELYEKMIATGKLQKVD